MARKARIHGLFVLAVIFLINLDSAATQAEIPGFTPVITSHTPSNLITDATAVDLYCEAEAWPTPNFAWYRNGTEAHDIEPITSAIEIDDESKPRFRSSVTVPVNEELYQCSARNVRGLAISPIIHLQPTGDIVDVNMCEDGLPGREGRIGLEGPRGPPGDKGEQGIQGPPGDISGGIKGVKGVTGMRGESGWPGEHGIMGRPGLRGDRGDRGQGMDEVQGELKGVKGYLGDDGQKGWRGRRGFKGEEGDPGLPGIKGEQGQGGIKGQPGLPGLPGVCGCR